jgi:hypothetical protein
MNLKDDFNNEVNLLTRIIGNRSLKRSQQEQDESDSEDSGYSLSSSEERDERYVEHYK